jgi:sugar phosphate isomerase/epimerase
VSGLLFGYNTNGLAHHRLEDALQIIAELCYKSVAITLDYNALNPLDPDWISDDGLWRAIHRRLSELSLRAVFETGARFLLDPRRKHFPTLLDSSADMRLPRCVYLSLALTLAWKMGVKTLSFWSGSAPDGGDHNMLMQRLVDSCLRLCDQAATLDVQLAFEPEPGMFIDTMDKFQELFERVNHPAFGLTLDIGHLHCMGEPIVETIHRWKDVLWNVHIEDMRRGVHEHLMFGEGEIDFPPVLAALKEIGYTGGVHVELSRHSHDAVETARRALAFLQDASK